MRQRYIVTYDVRSSSRVRKVFKVMRGFGDHIQYSVFRCDLSPTDLFRLKETLLEVIHTREDQVLFIDLGPADGRGEEAVESLGAAYLPPPAGAIVV